MPPHRVLQDIEKAKGTTDTDDSVDFGSDGIQADTIVESTEGAGTTIESVLLKDGAVTGDITGSVTADAFTLSDTGTLAAAGSNQGDAADISDDVTVVSASDGAKGVKLPSAVGGEVYAIYNNTSNVLLLYPNASDTINGAGVNTAVYVRGESGVWCTALNATTWSVVGGVEPLVASITAAGSSAADAQALTGEFNNVTAADNTKGVILPDASPGLRVVVYNNAASNTLELYSKASQFLNQVAGETGVTVAADTTVICYGISTTQWAAGEIAVAV